MSMSKPNLIVMSGLPGSGKSTIAECVAARLKIPLLSVDPIESAIVKAGVTKSFETGLAAYLVAETLASEQLKLGNSVIVDAVNAEEEGKNIWRSLADRYELELVILDVFVSDQVLHKKRLASRVRGLHGFSEITWDAVEARQKSFTAWKEPMLRLDSSKDLAGNVEAALRYIQARKSEYPGSPV
jgi:predicted kinase